MTFLKNPLNFLKKANRFFNLYLTNYKKFDSVINDYRKDHEKINNLINDYHKNQEKINLFIDDYFSNRDDLYKAVDIFNKNYYKCKEYFFRGEEHLFNLDTDYFFQMCFFNNMKLLAYSPFENKIYLKTEDGIVIATNDRFFTIDIVLARKEYSVPQIHQFKEFVVFDIGMNRGYASLNFASYDSCKAVYGFEIDSDTYDFALENFKLNPNLSEKIKPHNFGLYNEERELDLYYIPGYDGITTTKLEFAKIQPEWVREREQMKIKKAKVKEAGAVISNIIEKENITSNIILKIDTEGAENKIIDDLIDKGVLNKMDLIIGEMHMGEIDLDGKLDGFKRISPSPTSDIYNFCFVKEEFYNVFPQAITNNGY